MPVYPVIFGPPALLGWYPHMARRDASIWERYLKQEATSWEGFAYDVALGGQIIEDPDASEAELLGWRFSTAQRIDVVGNRGKEHWIIEVRAQARVGAVGAVMGYTMLAQREPWTELPLVPCVITDNVSPDVRWVAEQFDVQLIIVPEPSERILSAWPTHQHRRIFEARGPPKATTSSPEQQLELELQRARARAKGGQVNTVSLPGWDSVVHLAPRYQPTAGDRREYWNALRAGRPAQLSGEAIDAIETRRATAQRIASSATPGYAQAWGQMLTALDNVQDFTTTVALLGRMALWPAISALDAALPRFAEAGWARSVFGATPAAAEQLAATAARQAAADAYLAARAATLAEYAAAATAGLERSALLAAGREAAEAAAAAAARAAYRHPHRRRKGRRNPRPRQTHPRHRLGPPRRRPVQPPQLAWPSGHDRLQRRLLRPPSWPRRRRPPRPPTREGRPRPVRHEGQALRPR
jgi:hypothetical protein